LAGIESAVVIEEVESCANEPKDIKRAEHAINFLISINLRCKSAARQSEKFTVLETRGYEIGNDFQRDPMPLRSWTNHPHQYYLDQHVRNFDR